MNKQATTYKTIEVENSDGVFTLTLDRPPLNILNIGMLEEIESALDEAITAQCAFLVLSGKGKAFSAGADVAEHMPEKVERMLEVFHETIKKIAAFDGIVLARVHGSALGGGCELVLPADIILASSEARFGQPEIRLGVFPPVAMLDLPLMCPRTVAWELILTGRIVDAETALRMGLVSRVYPSKAFDEKCDKYLADLRGMSRSSLKLAKKVLRKIHPEEFAIKLHAAERVYLRELMATPDAAEGCKAFLEKRKPSWNNG